LAGRGGWEDRGPWLLWRRMRRSGIRARSSATRCGLYFRFALSLRDVSELMLARGVVVSHETIRQWTRKFGQDYATPCGADGLAG
jgi:hypothetical protein